mgnify:CR=1 FL=1
MSKPIGFYKDSRGRTRPVTRKISSPQEAISGSDSIMIYSALNKGKTVIYFVGHDKGRVHGVEGVDTIPLNSLSQFADFVKSLYRVSDEDYIDGDFRSDTYSLNSRIASITGKKTISFYGSMGSLEVRLE